MSTRWNRLGFSGESMKTRREADPWITQELLAFFAKSYQGSVEADDARCSPLLGKLEGLPPLLVQVGDQEILLSDSVRLHERAEAAGVESQLEIGDELWHVYQLFAPALTEATEALMQAGQFLRRKLGLD